MRYLLSMLFNRLDSIYEFHVLPALGRLWRIEILMRGVRLGNGKFFGRPVVKLHPKSFVEFGNDFILVSNNRRCSSGSIYSPCRIQTHSPTSKIIIGHNVGLNGTSIVSRSATISIGDGSMLAPNVVIMDSPFHKAWPLHKRGDYPGVELDSDVTIGNDVWIGAGCLLLPGTKIGDGCVVGARSVVRQSFPENCFIAGSPARIIKKLDGSPIGDLINDH